MFASALCAVHCVAGVLLAGGSSLGAALTDETVEGVFFAVAVCIALVALGRGYRLHRRMPGLAFGALALIPLLLARLVEWDLHATEAALSVLGAAGLVTAHAFNFVSTRRACAC